ncbi:hypothetical protein ACFE04_008903 [Oxalis oulophora]
MAKQQQQQQNTILIAFILILLLMTMKHQVSGNWCVARSDASNQALQLAIDYACSSGADCSPLQSSGLCFLPNTMQAHASYAFNSYFQRKNMAPGSCQFSGTATVAQTDPSYGSCVYPSSLSTAGGAITSTAPPASATGNYPPVPLTPVITSPPFGTSINPAGISPPAFLPDSSKAYPQLTVPKMLFLISCLLAISVILHPMVIL